MSFHQKHLYFFIMAPLSHSTNPPAIGEVCVSVNPYKTMDLYGPEYVDRYR